MITPEQVRHIAKLSRLGLKEEDITRFAKQLTDIMGYVEKLNEVKVVDVEPTSQVTGLINVMRADEESRFCEREELLGTTTLPVEKDQIKVKPVITA